jgi:chromosome segregation protein
MYLSRLQLLGFKSFPEKTELVFKPGMSCIVGPNGCGKTNLLDALRWALGESRMSVLRGARLEEIIFAGTRDFKPLGMAEVSITFDNHDQAVPSGYNEINVTRRLFRSGDSEFLINRTPCRLKDITDMFLDTGLGPSAYSVIEQSMVDVLLSDKTEDRRYLFEEAAGITKYKQRKRQALRKLDATEADLLRLQDVLAEVASQVSGLKRQVSKAERHQTLTEDIKRIGITIAADGWRRLIEDDRNLGKEIDNVRVEIDGLTARERALEVERESAALNRSEHEKQLKDLQAKLENSLSACHEAESRVSVLKEKVRNSRELAVQASKEVDNLLERGDAIEDEIQENRVDREKLESEIHESNTLLERTEADLDQLTARMGPAREELNRNQNELKTLNEKLSEGRENQLTLDLKLGADSERLEQIKRELDDLDHRLATITGERDAKQQQMSELTDQHNELHARLNQTKREIDELTESIEDVENSLRDKRSDLDKTQSRLEFLDGVILKYEGYGDGAVNIGQMKDDIPGVLDTVANLIDTDPKYSRMVQAVLGEYASYFVVEDPDSANEVLDRVRSGGLGRVGVVVLDRIEAAESDYSTSPPGDELIPVRSLVRSDGRIEPLLDFLFHGHYVGAPTSYSRDLPGGVNAVWNESGDMISSGGKILAAGHQDVVIVGRKREHEELSSKSSKIESSISDLTSKHDGLAESRSSIRNDVSGIEERISDVESRISSLKVETAGLEYQIAELTGQQNEKGRLVTELEATLDAMSRNKSDVSNEMTELKSLRDIIDARVADMQRDLNSLQDESAQVEKDCNRQRMQLINLEGRLETIKSNGARLTELRDDILNAMEMREVQHSEHLLICSTSLRDIAVEEENIKSRYVDIEERRSQAAEAGSRMDGLDGEIADLENRLRGVRKSLSELRERSHQLDLQYSAVQTKRERLREDSLKDYGFDPPSSSIKSTLSDEEREAMVDELEKLQGRLDNIGPVNMLALDEYDEQSKRHEFLKEQVEDLVSAKEDLKSTITRINATARKLFTETLDDVRTNFKAVFQELFEGGEADVRLEEDVDPLEANIVIKARPRGKKILSIQQLSGGERALTAISLLFSLYLVKPSPFCILDEVDAPLDDANIGRFLKMIRKFSETTQFVVITHNKLTMEAADILYGVTMERPGVSQIVGVNLENVEDVDSLLEGGSSKSVEPQEVLDGD